MRILLDTSFLIELRKGNKKAIESFEKMLDEVEDIVMPTIVLYELYKGAYEVLRLLKTEREINWINLLKNWITIFDITEEISNKAGRIYSILKSRGLEIDDGDILFLAFCEKEDIVLTANKNIKNACEILGIRCLKI